MSAPTREVSWLAAAGGVIGRDVVVLRRSWRLVVLRIVVQPALFVFIFAYVFPKIGQGIGGPAGSATFSTLLVPGTVTMAIFLNGVQSVGLPLIGDLGYTRQIEDRASAPLPIALVALLKVLSGSCEGIVAGAAVLPFALLLPSTSIDLDLSLWLIIAVPAVAFAGACFGLLVGSSIGPERIPQLFSIIVVPMTFLGASYYSWAELSVIRWLQVLELANPVVYANEWMRATMSPSVEHMNPLVSASGLIAWSAAMFFVGLRTFRRKLTS